jgi:hypothetical protein
MQAGAQFRARRALVGGVGYVHANDKLTWRTLQHAKARSGARVVLIPADAAQVRETSMFCPRAVWRDVVLLPGCGHGLSCMPEGHSAAEASLRVVSSLRVAVVVRELLALPKAQPRGAGLHSLGLSLRASQFDI